MGRKTVGKVLKERDSEMERWRDGEMVFFTKRKREKEIKLRMNDVWIS